MKLVFSDNKYLVAFKKKNIIKGWFINSSFLAGLFSLFFITFFALIIQINFVDSIIIFTCYYYYF